MLGFLKLVYSTCLLTCVLATPIIWDGRAPFNLTNTDLETSTGPYLRFVYTALILHISLADRITFSVVKGSENATHVRRFWVFQR